MKFILSTIFLILGFMAGAQIIVTRTYSPEEVKNLQRSLKGQIADTARIDISLKLARYYLYRAPPQEFDLSNAEIYLKKAASINSPYLSGKRAAQLFLFKASLFIRKGDTITGSQFAKKAISQFQMTDDAFDVAIAYLELSRCYDSKREDHANEIKNLFNKAFQHVPINVPATQQYASMIELRTFYHTRVNIEPPPIKEHYVLLLLQTYKRMKDKVGEFWTRKELADLHYQRGLLSQAIDELLQIEKEQKAGNYDMICFTYDLLSGLYMANNKFDKALHYAFETLKNVKTSLDSLYLTLFHTRVAGIYTSTGSIAEAVEWNIKRLNYMISINQTWDVYTHLDNIITDIIGLGKPNEALQLVVEKTESITPANDREKRSMFLCLSKSYEAVNDNAMANKYCEKLIALNEQRIRKKEIDSDPWADQFLASFYIKTGQLKKAEKFYERSANKFPDLNKDFFLFKFDSAKGNFLSAIKHLLAMQARNDSIFTAAKSKQIEELKIQYETEKKDQRIQFNEQNIQLLTRQDQLQKSKLQQETYLRNIGFAAAVLLIIIVGLLYSRFRLKQKTNKKLESQQREISQQNSSLQHLLSEKEWLLKEIHHRVKNNLQIVMSLLNSQSAYIDNPYALNAIHDSQHRVHAMSLIHQKLYGSQNVSSIDMSVYVRELVSYLKDSFDTGQRIQFDCRVEALEMDVSHAVPLGLILNEAITNAIKYAFPSGRSGVVTITLSSSSPGKYLLCIADNGIGLPYDLQTKKSGSLGMSLIKGLSEDLNGQLVIENNNGTTIKISFTRETKFTHLKADTTTAALNN